MMARSRSSTSNALWPATWLSMLSTSDVHFIHFSPRERAPREHVRDDVHVGDGRAARAGRAGAAPRGPRGSPLVARDAPFRECAAGEDLSLIHI